MKAQVQPFLDLFQNQVQNLQFAILYSTKSQFTIMSNLNLVWKSVVVPIIFSLFLPLQL